MTSDPWGEQGPPPDWVGEVSTGVDAWTGRAGPDAAPESRPGPDPEVDQEPETEEVARKILLDQLTGQARSRRELAQKLARRNVPDEIATRLLDRFEEVGLVDDEAFARAWVASRQSGKGLARRALAQELRRKGIADEVVQTALDEVDPDDEHEAGRRLVRKKLRTMTRLDDRVKVRRLVGMLGRKGFPPGTAYALVREVLDADLLDADVTDEMPESDP